MMVVVRFTPHQKMRAAERELTLRRAVYPKRVKEGRLTIREAREEIELMKEIAEDYRRLADIEDGQERLL